MKQLFFFICLSTLCIFAACEEEPEMPDCLTFQQNPAWATGEPFKINHTIQFPATYTGQGFTNNGDFFFLKSREDDAVIFYWSLCGFAGCEEYGFFPLDTPLPDMLSSIDDALLNNTDSGIGFYIQNDLTAYIEFCENDIPIAVFYYNTNATADGALFLKLDDDQLHAALMVQYDNAQQQEVESILQTVL